MGNYSAKRSFSNHRVEAPTDIDLQVGVIHQALYCVKQLINDNDE